MPGPIIRRPRYPAQVPPWLQDALTEAQLSPASTAVWGGEGEPVLAALGKKLSDLLDTVFTPAKGSGLPRRLRFTGLSREGQLQLHPESQAAGRVVGPAAYEASPAQVDQLLRSGQLDLQQPPQAAVDPVRARLRAILDAAGPEYKAAQYAKAKK